MSALADWTVFVVDGDQGVGLKIAHQLVQIGVQRIGLISRDAERGAAAATEIFRSASGIWALSATGDPMSTDDARRMVSELSASLGAPDVLVEHSPARTAVRAVVHQSMRSLAHGVIACIDTGHDVESHGVTVLPIAPGDDFAEIVLSRLAQI